MFNFFKKSPKPLNEIKIAVWINTSDIACYLDSDDARLGRVFKHLLVKATDSALCEFANEKTGDSDV